MFTSENNIWNMIFLWGDLHGIIDGNLDDMGFAWGFGLREANAEDKTILYFASVFEPTLASTCFKKMEKCLRTNRSGMACSQIDLYDKAVG